MEWVDILKHKDKILHQAVFVVLAHIMVAERDLPRIYIPDALELMAKCRLATAGRPDDCGS